MKAQSKVASPNKMLIHSDFQINSNSKYYIKLRFTVNQKYIKFQQKCQGGKVSTKLWATCNLMDFDVIKLICTNNSFVLLYVILKNLFVYGMILHN